MKRKGSIALSKRGLLNTASGYKAIEKSKKSSENSEADILTVEKISEAPRENNTLEHRAESKLVSFKKWKKEIKDAQGSTTNGKHKYEHELVSFLNWKEQTDAKYDGIKRIAQNLAPQLFSKNIEDSDEDVVEEVLYEESLEETLSYNEKIEINENYTIDTLAKNIRSSTEIDSGSNKSQNQNRDLLSAEKIWVENSSFSAVEPEIVRNKIVYQRKKSIILVDVAIVIICLIGSFVSLFYFYESLNQSFIKANEEPVAIITFKHKAAQRKFSDRVAWERVKQSAPVYNGDIIRTADFSEVKITFEDGNTIYLHEHSLAQVFYNEEGVSVDFSGGGISIGTTQTGKGVRLTSGGTIVAVEAGASLVASSQISIVDSDFVENEPLPITLQLTSGNAFVSSSFQDEVVAIEEGESLTVSSEGQSMSEPTVSVFSPELNAKYLCQTEDAFPVEFQWTAAEEISTSLTLEISDKRDFSELTQSHDVSNLDSAVLSIGEGYWYWRLYSTEPELGQKGSFRVIKSNAPKTIVPKFGEEYLYRTINPSIRFTWEDDANAIAWLFEIADNEKMENPFVSQSTTQVSSIISVLSTGTWYWRVIPVYPENLKTEIDIQNAGSQVSMFVVRHVEGILPVELVSPKTEALLDTTTNQYFTWKHSTEASSYTLSISKYDDMRFPIFEKKLTDNYLVFSNSVFNLDKGLYYWSVTQKDELGTESLIGEIRNFISLDGVLRFETNTPSINTIIHEDEIANTQFKWNANIPFDTYFQVATDEAFTDIVINTAVSEKEISGIELPVGKWYWRIESKDEKVSTVYSTEPQVFFVEYLLDTVSFLTPRKDSVILVERGESVRVSWAAVENAEYYEFRLFRTSNRTVPVYENLFVEGTSLSLNMFDREKGNYVVTVRAVSENTPSLVVQKSNITETSFTTRVIEPVQLESPRNGIEIEGVSALTNPSTVRWSSSEKIEESEFILSNSTRGLSSEARENGERPASAQVKFRLEDPSGAIKLPPLTPGTWYWTVFGKTDGGYDISAREPFRIVVKEVESFPVPSVIEPLAGTVFGIEYLSQNDYIDFTWETVENAETYNFMIKNESGDIIFDKNIEKATNIRFYELSLLDRGNFTWSVEAKRSLPEDIIQKGKRKETPFTIDLPQHIVPRDTTSEDLYGL